MERNCQGCLKKSRLELKHERKKKEKKRKRIKVAKDLIFLEFAILRADKCVDFSFPPTFCCIQAVHV